MSTNHPGKGLLCTIWLALMLLLFVTWGVARIDLGKFNIVAAMTIAVIKLLLVVLFFMHLRYRGRLTWVFAAAGVLWLAIMISLAMSDYLTRG